MLSMRHLLLFLFVMALISACTEMDPDNGSKLPTSLGVSGFVQKGPFVSGSDIIVQVLDENFNPTGQSYTVTTIDDFGSFNLESAITGKYVEFIAQGFYFNEVAGSISNASLTLRALAEVTPDLTSNVNVLTTLSKNRIIELVKNEQMTFADAKGTAETEVLSIFNIALNEAFDFNTMDIRASSAQDAALLAISCILQGQLTIGELSELISKIILDIQDNGEIDTPSISETIRNNAAHLSLAQIKKNLLQRYAQLGLQHSVPAFEKFAKRLVPITVVKTSPFHNTTDIRYDITSASVSFNKALIAGTVNTNSVKLAESNGTSVPGQVLYNADSFKIEFKPSGELLPEKTYTLTVTENVQTLDSTGFAGTQLTFSTLNIDIASDLLAWFPLNGDATDATGHGFNANAVNVIFSAGIRDNACQFAGEGSYLEIPNVMNLSEKVWSYSIWFRLDDLPAGTAPFLLATRLSANTFWDVPLYIRPSIKSIATYNESALNMGDNVVAVNQWHHAAIVINNGTIHMYLDGNLKATQNNFWTRQSDPGYEDFRGTGSGSYEFYTGKYYISERFRGESFPAYMKGSVDNVRFYKRALNKYEILKLFTDKE
jgi:hypothetical protein